MKLFVMWIVGLVFVSVTTGQEHYQLEFWGIPCGTITMDQTTPGTLIFNTVSTGVLDWLFPFRNEYSVTYDTSTFTVLGLSKETHQRSAVQKLQAKWYPDNHTIVYNKKTVLHRETEMVTVLSLLALIEKRTPEDIDTKWFPMEHEGAIYRARFIYAGNDTLIDEPGQPACYHYRLDFETSDTSEKILAHSDFFHEYITSDGMVKQLWVTIKKPRKIVKAQVSLSGITATTHRFP